MNYKKRLLLLFSAAISTLLMSGCYQVCPSYDRLSLQHTAPRTTNAPDIVLPEHDSTLAGLGHPDAATTHTHGEVWAVPRATGSGDNQATSSLPGSNAPWTAVVYTQSAFVLSEDEPLEGTLTLRIARDGTISASLPPSAASRSAADVSHAPDRGTGVAIGTEVRSNYHWLRRLSSFGSNTCETSMSEPSTEQGNTDDLLRVQFMLARTPQSAGNMAVFGVQIRGNGRDYSHSQILPSAEKTFNAEFADGAAPANTSAAAGLRVFRINITAQRVEGHVILPGSEGRLIDAKFDPQGHMLYVVNLGFVLQDDRGGLPSPRTGALTVDADDVRPH